MRVIITLTLLFFPLTLIGCSRGIPVTPVTGVVMLNGKPVEEATVTFIPENVSCRGASGGTNAAGHFALRTFAADKAGAMQGKFLVTVNKLEVTVSGGAPVFKQLMPEVYTKQETSPLRTEVKNGRNHFVLEMTTENKSDE